jgi:chromosome segregation protein
MFKFKEVELYHWDFWKRPVIPLDEQIITIIGPNGSGKTTFLDALRTLLNAKQSHKRDVRKYLRRNGRAAIKAIIDNTSNVRTKPKPFAPICMKNEVTIAVVFEKKEGGKLTKKFYLSDGRVDLEDIFSGKLNSYTPTEYNKILQDAGLTKAVLKVIALEQGSTDELCEKSPRELLELVFDVFGDSAVLDKYRISLSEQQELEEEIKLDEINYNNEVSTLRRDELDIEQYKENRNRILELEELENRTLYDAKTAKSLSDYYRLLKEKSNLKLSLDTLINSREENELKESNYKSTYQELRDRRETYLQEKDKLNTEKSKYLEEINTKESMLGQFQLLKKEYDNLENKDLNQLLEKYNEDKKEHDSVLLDERNLNQELQNLRAELKQIELDQDSHYISRIKPFQQALEKEGIEAKALAKLIEIKDEKWQLAIESLLGRDRFTILVEEKDFIKAGKLGEKENYRSYISVFEKTAKSELKKNSARSYIEFTDDRIPEWILKNLNNACLIDDFEQYKDYEKDFDVFITANGYRKDQRGSVSVKVNELFCGKAAINNQKTYLRNEIKKIDKEHAKAKSLLEALSHECKFLEEKIRLIENYEKAKEELSDKVTDFSDIKEKIEKINEQVHEISEKESETKLNVETANQNHKDILSQLERVREEEKVESMKYSQLEKRLANIHQELLETNENLKTFCFYDPKGQIPKELKLSKIEDRIDYLKQSIHSFSELNHLTELHLERYEKRKTELEQRWQRLLRSKQHIADIKQKTDRSREEYIRVLNASIQFYRKNVEDLSLIAHADVSVTLPKIENSIEAINAAGLEISFAFDGKKQHKLDSGESSGGQKVIESLILLISLLKESGDTTGGFVFIDEPFAHLDLVNVDRVGQFLLSTGAQYLITTPNTQNIGVFRPSKLTISTFKKRPADDYALAPSYVKR